jgi:hypothetical protein
LTPEDRQPVQAVFAPPLTGPERCTAYDPAALTLRPLLPPAGAVITDGRTAVARAADEVCSLGDPDGGPADALQYWKRNGRLAGELPAPSPTEPVCLAYDPRTLAVTEGGGGWQVVDSARAVLAQLADRAAADQALALARHYQVECVVGRDSGEPGDPTTTYWR